MKGRFGWGGWGVPDPDSARCRDPDPHMFPGGGGEGGGIFPAPLHYRATGMHIKIRITKTMQWVSYQTYRERVVKNLNLYLNLGLEKKKLSLKDGMGEISSNPYGSGVIATSSKVHYNE